MVLNGSQMPLARFVEASTITVLAPAGGGTAPAAVDISLSGVPATLARGQTFTASATVANTGTGSATGYSVVVSFSPTDAMRLQSPTTATQSVGTLAAGSTAR